MVEMLAVTQNHAHYAQGRIFEFSTRQLVDAEQS